jgi:hypothetical protein
VPTDALTVLPELRALGAGTGFDRLTCRTGLQLVAVLVEADEDGLDTAAGTA